MPIKQNKTLAIDIGGTGIKMMMLDDSGKSISERTRVKTPQPATPQAMLEVICGMFHKQAGFTRISVGFPGVVKNGVIHTAPNLDPSWAQIDLKQILENHTNRPVRVANDADVQGLGNIVGKGVELVLTLGTGMGSALFTNGILVPNLELGHHPLHKGKTYEDLLKESELKKIGKKKWNAHLKHAIETLSEIFNYDYLYIGGGNSSHIKLDLPSNVKKTKNIAGLIGGIKLWSK